MIVSVGRYVEGVIGVRCDMKTVRIGRHTRRISLKGGGSSNAALMCQMSTWSVKVLWP